MGSRVRAAVCSAYGPPHTLRIDEQPRPELGAGQARVRVHAAAVNFPDVLIVADRYQLSVPTPFVPGSEFAGVVEQVADDVDDFGPGDRVSGAVLVGAFAEEVAVDAAVLRPIPEGIDFRSAAAFGVAHSTAYHVLRSVACIEPGEVLVVLGAGGGVGLATVQLGAVLGARVVAVASSDEKLAVAASCGAIHGVCHRSVDLREALRERLPDGTDAVVDTVGGSLSEPALRSLRWGGRFVTVGYASGEIPKIPLNLVLLKGIAILGFQFRDFARHAPGELQRNDAELLNLLEQGHASPHVGASFPLNDVAAAMQLVADGQVIGKAVIDVSQ